MLQKKDIVVFDFDGTLSWPDTNTAFWWYCAHRSVRPWLFLPLIGICGIVHIFNQWGIWWRENMRRCITSDMVNKYANDFVKEHRKKRFKWAKKCVATERARGAKVLLITASPDYLIPELVNDMNFDAVIFSKMDAQKPWKYKFLCCGPNKVVALDKWAMENKIIPNVIRAYSDSKSDLPIMSIAKEQIWINPKTGTRKRQE